MPALVDTSVWIEFFRPKGDPGVKRALRVALEEGVVVTVAPVLTELLVGLNPARSLVPSAAWRSMKPINACRSETSYTSLSVRSSAVRVF